MPQQIQPVWSNTIRKNPFSAQTGFNRIYRAQQIQRSVMGTAGVSNAVNVEMAHAIGRIAGVIEVKSDEQIKGFDKMFTVLEQIPLTFRQTQKQQTQLFVLMSRMVASIEKQADTETDPRRKEELQEAAKGLRAEGKKLQVPVGQQGYQALSLKESLAFNILGINPMLVRSHGFRGAVKEIGSTVFSGIFGRRSQQMQSFDERVRMEREQADAHEAVGRYKSSQKEDPQKDLKPFDTPEQFDRLREEGKLDAPRAKKGTRRRRGGLGVYDPSETLLLRHGNAQGMLPKRAEGSAAADIIRVHLQKLLGETTTIRRILETKTDRRDADSLDVRNENKQRDVSLKDEERRAKEKFHQTSVVEAKKETSAEKIASQQEGSDETNLPKPKTPGAGVATGIAGAAGMTFFKSMWARISGNKPKPTVSWDPKMRAYRGPGGKILKKETAEAMIKTTAKGGSKFLSKKLPFGLGLLAALGFAASRLKDGDGVGALGEIAEGAAAVVPGIGTAASMGIGGAMIARDIRRAKSNIGETLGAEPTASGSPIVNTDNSVVNNITNTGGGTSVISPSPGARTNDNSFIRFQDKRAVRIL